MSTLNKILDWITAQVLAWFPSADPSLVRVGAIASTVFVALLFLGGAAGWRTGRPQRRSMMDPSWRTGHPQSRSMMDPSNPWGLTNPNSPNNPWGYTHPNSPNNPTSPNNFHSRMKRL